LCYLKKIVVIIISFSYLNILNSIIETLQTKEFCTIEKIIDLKFGENYNLHVLVILQLEMSQITCLYFGAKFTNVFQKFWFKLLHNMTFIVWINFGVKSIAVATSNVS